MHRRHLPHIYPDGAWLFVTWHLHGSLPRALYPPRGEPNAGKAFVWMDRHLDSTREGPMFLRQPEVAEVVVRAFHQAMVAGLCDVQAFVVMANYVQILMRPLQQGGRVLQWLKGSTAREANLLLGRTGQPFWQRVRSRSTRQQRTGQNRPIH